MAERNPVEGIESVGVKASERLAKSVDRKSEANKQHFDALMEQKQPKAETPDKVVAENRPSLEEVVRTKHQVGPIDELNTDRIIAEAKETVTTIDRIKQRLEDKLASADPNLQKAAVPVLKNKLTHIDDSLRIALSKAGADGDVDGGASGSIAALNPVEKFIGSLSHAQYQLESLGGYLGSLQGEDGNINPANLLAVQIKVNQVQQELEFFSNMLNKMLEGTKTIMNVQI